MEPRDFFDALDQSTAAVAEAEFERLSDGMSKGDVAANIRHGLAELEKLQSGRSPDYDNRWVALFYLTWYQPGQIGLCRQLIKRLPQIARPQRDNPRLHVVDFGCGALAMQLAIAWAAADVPAHRRFRESIWIDSYDIAYNMVRLGHDLWEAFRHRVEDKEDLFDLRRVVEKTIRIRCKFVANTRNRAFDLMAEKLGCPRTSFQKQYMMHYRDVRDVLKEALPSLGEGKDGFAPPF